MIEEGAKGIPPLWTWEFWNSTLVTTVLGALILSLVVTVVMLILSHKLEKKRQRFGFQLEIFRSFNEGYSDMRNHFTDLRILREYRDAELPKKVMDVYNRMALFSSMHNLIDAAFKDRSLLWDVLELNKTMDQIPEELCQESIKDNFEKFDALMDRCTYQSGIVTTKMMREMRTGPAFVFDKLLQDYRGSISQTMAKGEGASDGE